MNFIFNHMDMPEEQGIGVFDSGVGGLTVAGQIARILPKERIFYFGDTANLPYGDKTEEEIRFFVGNIIEFLMAKGIKAMVMACNTSSAVVLPSLGELGIPVLGVIEFASENALKVTRNRRVGVVANPVTVRSGAYPEMIGSLSGHSVSVFQQACPRWVPLVESGNTSGASAEEAVREDVSVLLKEGIDTLILGCTHYPYLSPLINKVSGGKLALVNPAEALAFRLKNILESKGNTGRGENPRHRFFVSGEPADFQERGGFFFGRELPPVEKACLEQRREILV